ncbi:MAG: hypothetical protein KY466_04770 [Gemmatimonadetes bacterium]|nr:hypothetical protein [Gemmatimonadota bacterium]
MSTIARGRPAAGPAADDDRAPVSRLRTALPADNRALIALAAACPMEGDIGLRVDRAPDFFALNRLEGDAWEVAVVESPAEEIAGCVALSRRTAYVHGRAAPTFYTGDLKVHPSRRGGEAADALERWVAASAARTDPERPILLTVLKGNAAMEKRMPGPRGLPRLEPFATVRSHAVPLLLPRRRDDDLRITLAGPRDLDPMMALWGRVAPERQLAPVLDPDALGRWIADAPGLELRDYLLARDRGGTLQGFVAFWDQAPLKTLRVTSYSRRMALVRGAINLGARGIGAATVPPVGEPLRARTAVHLCVPAGRPDVLRALVLEAYGRFRGRYALLLVGLDIRDPLRAALAGLWSQPTDIHACVTAGTGRYRGPRLDERPLHYEIALV